MGSWSPACFPWLCVLLPLACLLPKPSFCSSPAQDTPSLSLSFLLQFARTLRGLLDKHRWWWRDCLAGLAFSYWSNLLVGTHHSPVMTLCCLLQFEDEEEEEDDEVAEIMESEDDDDEEDEQARVLQGTAMDADKDTDTGEPPPTYSAAQSA